MALPRVRCAICGKQVDRVTILYSESARESVLRVDCHGAVERMTVSDGDKAAWAAEERAQWEAVSRGEVEGVAFANKQIGNGPPQG